MPRWFHRSDRAAVARLARYPLHVLIAAPTGSGKTLAAFFAAIDSLFRIAP